MAKMKGGGLSAAMKSVGRNMARANLQSASKKIPMKFAEGGPVPAGGNTGGSAKAFGGGTVRGGKAQTKGKGWQGAI